MFPVKSIIKDSKLYCPCCYRFEIDFTVGSGARIHTQDKTEIEFTFDEIEARCPKCHKLNQLESPLLDEVLKPKGKHDDQTHKVLARLRPNKLSLHDWRFGVERLTLQERDQFIATLSDAQRKVYKAMNNPDNKVGAKVYDAIKA